MDLPGDLNRVHSSKKARVNHLTAPPAQEMQQAVHPWADGPYTISRYGHPRSGYGLTLIRSLIMSNVSLGTTFLATNSPFTL